MPPNCELRGRGLQRALNVDSSRLRRKDAAMVYIPQTHHQVLGVGISATCCEASKHVAADRRIAVDAAVPVLAGYGSTRPILPFETEPMNGRKESSLWLKA
jgi:hypothetical protein